MKEQIEENNTEMSSLITRYEEFVQKNKKFLIAGGSIIAVAVIIFCVFKFYINPKNNREASAEIFYAENFFDEGIDSLYYGNVAGGNALLQKSLKGEGNMHGFLAVIDDYGCTKSGNLAKYYAGIASLRLGNYADAIKFLKDYDAEDFYSKPLALMARADALVETNSLDDAIELYLKAAETNPNEVTSPSALVKAGWCYDLKGDKAKALECFQRVKKEFPGSTEWPEIDRYIGIEEANN
jgi:tetratricopeptide (TPR) repeat protein